MTHKHVQIYIKRLAKEYNVVVEHLEFDSGAHGKTDLPTQKITLYNKKFQTPVQYLCTFFHELGHVYCIRNGKYPSFHVYYENKSPKLMTKMALRAEIYTDKIGKKLMKKHFPKLKYIGSYSVATKLEREWLKECFKERYS